MPRNWLILLTAIILAVVIVLAVVIILTSIKWRQKIGVKKLTKAVRRIFTRQNIDANFSQTARSPDGQNLKRLRARAKKSGQSVTCEIVQKL